MIRELTRPMLFVHGYSGWASQGKPLSDLVTRNPENRFGGTFREGDDAIRELSSNCIYHLSLSRPRASFVESSPELTRAVALLNDATGQEVDIVAHSMGGLVAREHLDRGQAGIHNLFMLGTPNLGVPLDLLAGFSLRLASPLLGNAPLALRSAQNRHLAELNERWPEQREQLHQAYTLAGTRIPTASPKPPFLGRGDGVVAEASVRLPGATHVTVHQLDPFSSPLADNHLSLLGNPKVLAFIADPGRE